MKEYEINITDIHRILFGDVPYHFFIEVIIRVTVIYILLMLSMRMMGKRMSSQLSRNEMAAVASLAAAIGVPLMSPDRGLLPAVVIAIIIVSYQMFIAWKAAVNRKFESVTQDKFDTLVKDGVLELDTMLATRVSTERIFAQLRSEGISHLGMVGRLYFEAGGFFSLVENPDPSPGLSVIPVWDEAFSIQIHQKTDLMVCDKCGAFKTDENLNRNGGCKHCKNKTWVQAVTKSDS